MWRQVVDWYQEWEDEHLAVLEQPGLAALAAPGYRRYCANKLAELSLIERRQLLEFSRTYQGRRLHIAIAKLALAFSLGGVLLHLAVPNISWAGAIVAANFIGLLLAMGVTSAWFNYRKIANGKLRLAGFIVGCATLGALFGSANTVLMSGESAAVALQKLPRILAWLTLGAGLLVAVPLIVISVLRNRQYELLTVQLQRDAEAERLARELSESQLRLLRAQIEPHFLFNTLGAVQQLAEQGAPRAAELTANLIAFLRASLSEMRSEQACLGAEFGLVEAYLQVMKVRLGARLDFTLTLPDALANVTVPSMILLTLVENSIKHGIEPSLRGGEITVSAQALDGTVRLRVQDSGVGLSTTLGTGLGLENVRHRLQLAYPGSAATLAMHDADPGVISDITIPCQHAER
jgi:signal transduction histidine kinase